MHRSSYDEMERMIAKYVDLSVPIRVVDVGSCDVNGSYKPLFPSSFDYVGVDMSPGENVDIVMPDPYTIPLGPGDADLLISGQCFEHVKNPFRLMDEVSRIVAPGGYLLLVAPFIFPEHRYPVDCWRFLSDGWAALFEESEVELVETKYVTGRRKRSDCWGIGRKRK